MENLDALQAYYDVYVHAVGPQPITNNVGISIPDYAALDPQNHFTVELFVLPEGTSTADLYTNVSGMLQGLESLRGDIRMVLVPDEETMTSLQTFVEEHDTLDIEYQKLIKDLKTCEMQYENGALKTSEQEFKASVGDLS